MRAAQIITADDSLAKMVHRQPTMTRCKRLPSLLVANPRQTCTSELDTRGNSRYSKFEGVVGDSRSEHRHRSAASEARHIQLFVNSSLRSPLCLQLPPSTTISSLKELLQDKLGVQPGKQHLYTRVNVKLCDSLSLEDYHIEQDTNIELRIVSGLMGGMEKQKSGKKGSKKKVDKKLPSDVHIDSELENDQAAAGANADKQSNSGYHLSRVQSLLKHVIPKRGCDKQEISPSKQKCQHETTLSSEKQTSNKEQVDDSNVQTSDTFQVSSSKSPSRTWSLLGNVIPKRWHHKKVSKSKEDKCMMTSPEEQQVEREQVVDPHRLPPNLEMSDKSQQGAEQIHCEEKMISSQERQGLGKVDSDPDMLLSTSHMTQGQDLAPSPLSPATQHSSAVCSSLTSGLLRPPSQEVKLIRDVTISGDHSPCFLGPVSGTFNVTFMSGKESSGPSTHVPPISAGKSQDATPAQVAADSCENALKTWYTSTGSYVEIIPWIDDDTKHIMDIYTMLELVNNDKQGKLKSYQGIFLVQTREGNIIKRIVLTGLAGVGKSTLIDKIAYDWAIQCCVVLQKYKLLFVLKMHSLDQTSDLIDSVFNQVLDRDTSVDRCALKSYIDSNPDKVLILLDGFDEFMTTTLCESSFGSLLKILNRKEGRDCCVVVTTRSSHLNKLVSKSLVQKPFTLVRVLGFSAEDIKQYVGKFYSDDPDKASSLFERIHASDVLLDLARSPMLLLLMCVLWREDSRLPDTMSRLYSEALRYIFKRKVDVSPKDISEVVTEIGKVAFHGLVAPVQLLSFEEREFEKRVLDTAIRVGLLTCQKVVKGLDTHNSVQFIHMTFQEFCAAKYFQSLSKTDTEEFEKILDQIERTIKNHPAGFEYLLRFCCGDDEACAEKILKMMQEYSCSNTALKLSLTCYFESQSKNMPPDSFIDSVVTDKVCIEEYNSDCLNAYMWFLKHVMDQTEGKANAPSTKVQEIMMCRCNLQRFDAGLTYSLRKMTNLSVLKLKACSLTTKNMELIASSLGNTANLTELDLSGNEDLGGSVATWVPHLHVLKCLQKLILDDCHVNREDVRHLAVSVGVISSLQDCSVQTDVLMHCDKDDLVWPTSPLVKQTNRRTGSGSGICLDMIECSLTGTDMEEIMDAMGNRGDVVDLILCRNYRLGGSVGLWVCNLKYLQHLELLVLSDCSLKCTDIEHIAVSVSDMSSLVKLDLSDNVYLAGLAAFWAPHMQVMKHLRRLDFKSCSFTGEDVKYIFISLGRLPSLVRVDFSFNEAMGGSAAVWADHLQQMKSLKKLYLRQCGLTSDDVKHIAVPMGNMPKCVELNLSSNEKLSDSASSWTPHLTVMRHLKRLDLHGCNLNKQDLKSLATSVGCMRGLVECTVKSAYLSGIFLMQPTETGIRLNLSQRSLTGKDLADILQAMSNRADLVEFILSGNDAMSGSAVLWCPCLRNLKHLEKLELHHCSLQSTDIEHIAVTLKDMSSLINLDISLNDTLGGFGKKWSPHLKQMKHLQVLDLSSCALKGRDVQHIALSLSDMTNLVELKLSHNDPLGGSAHIWASCLQPLNHLQTLEMDECNIKRQEFKYIAASVGCMKNLVNCSIRSNYMGGRFKCVVQPVNSGVQVSLSERLLTGTDLAEILEALSSRADLVELSLVGIDALRGSATLWASHLKGLKCLQRLVLNRCSLDSTDIKHIGVSVSGLASLVEVELSGSTGLGGSSEMWAPYLQQMHHLERLYLSLCGLTFDDVKHIATACSDTSMPNLSELDLSCNEALSGLAALWAPHLTQMQNIQKLTLSQCLLTGEDKKHLAVLLGDKTDCSY